MAAINWTKEQLSAITTRGGTLLVSAAAGSGKTAVLSERVARLLADEENPLLAGRLLITTFSNAAAAEMRERIEKKLEERVAADPGNRFLREQQQALQSAQIGTIHAFCLGLIRNNFQFLELPADLRVGDERELQLIRRDVLSSMIAGRYEQGDPLFLQTVELFSAARNDNLLLKTVLRLYEFTRSHPFPQSWLERKLSLYRTQLPISETIWGQEILDYAAGALHFACGEMAGAAAVMKEDEKLSSAWLPAYLSDLDQLQKTLFLVKEKDWDGTLHALRTFTFIKKRPLRGYEDEETKKALDQVRKSCKELVERLRDRTFHATLEQAADDIRELGPKIAMLFSLVQEFSAAFSQAKIERRLLDFSDLEQYALQLLCRQDRDGTLQPTELALSLRNDYAMILVDEYQDTNEAQEMIFQSVSDGQNLFMVGDVKQSIYGFRQASPRIFMEKKDSYHPFDGKHFPAALTLGANFRSHPSICEAVNDLFAACMSRRVGQVDYGQDERLLGLGCFAENPSAGMSLELLDTAGSDEDAAVCEARYVAERISEMLSGDMGSEGGVLRRVRPGDIGILLRTMKGRAEHFLEALAEKGIPAVSGSQSNFLHTLEVSTALSILRAVNNPLLDIPLVAAMMSPAYAYSAGEIARIRLYRRGEPFYMALLEGERQGDASCARFLCELRELRMAAADMSTERLLRFLYERTMLPSLVAALEGADERQANLNLLVSYAKGYEKSGCRSLSQFLRLVDDMEENGEDLPPAVVAARENAVQIMSVHRSKGLEFPVVFLCDTQKRFNREDMRKNALLHASLGFACVRRDEDTMSQFVTVPYEAVRLAMERESSSEEMRILYVALTRAKERLVVTGASDKLQKKLQSFAVRPQADARFPEHALTRAQSWMEWLCMAALCMPGGAPLREYAGLPQAEGIPCRGQLRCRVVYSDGKKTQEAASTLKQAPSPAAASSMLLSRLESQLSARYPYEAATVVPTKMAVTAIVRDEEDNGAYRFKKRPQFITRERLTAAERGNAFHKFMLFADLSYAAGDVQKELQRLIQLQFLSREEGEAISLRTLQAFFQSRLWERLRKANRVEREFRFMAQLGKEQLGGFLRLSGETVTVQGICDLVFFEGEQAVLADYKTDQVDSPDILLERYHKQLLLYRDILQGRLHIPVKECILYSTALSQEILVPLPECSN